MSLPEDPIYPSLDPNSSIWDDDRAYVLSRLEERYGQIRDHDRYREAYAYVLPRVDSGLGLNCGRRECDLVWNIVNCLGMFEVAQCV